MLSLPQGEEVLETARGYLGYPYDYGNSGHGGFDCSGFVQTVFAQHGYALPRTSRSQATIGRSISFSELQEGDLLFFADGSTVTHVTIYAGHQQMIHASTGRHEVVIDNVDLPYYKNRFVGARRILDQSPEAYGLKSSETAVPLSSGTSLDQMIFGRSFLNVDRADSHVGLRTQGANKDGKNWLAISPAITLRSELWDTDLRLHVPFAASLPSWNNAWSYRQPEDFLRILDYLRIGSPTESFYLEAGREFTLSLGSDLMVRHVLPASFVKNTLHIPWKPTFATTAAIDQNSWRLEYLVDDVVTPAVIAGRVEYHRSSSFALSGVIDPRAPNINQQQMRGSIIIDGTAPMWSTSELKLGLLGQLGFLSTLPASFGGDAGLYVDFSIGALQTRTRLTVATLQPGFVPQLFSADYLVLRRGGFNNKPLWPSLDDTAQHGRLSGGWVASTEWSYTRRLHFSLQWRHVGNSSPRTPREALQWSVALRDFYIPGLSWFWSTYVAYFQHLVPTLKMPVLHTIDREILLAGIRLRPSRYLSMGFQLSHFEYYKQSTFSGLVDLSLELPL